MALQSSGCPVISLAISDKCVSEASAREAGKWRAEGVDWPEKYENLQYDFIRQRQDWGLIGFDPFLPRFYVNSQRRMGAHKIRHWSLYICGASTVNVMGTDHR
jgi:hypothetical protein